MVPRLVRRRNQNRLLALRGHSQFLIICEYKISIKGRNASYAFYLETTKKMLSLGESLFYVRQLPVQFSKWCNDDSSFGSNEKWLCRYKKKTVFLPSSDQEQTCKNYVFFAYRCRGRPAANKISLNVHQKPVPNCCPWQNKLSERTAN